jgi:hypothetical protein
MVGSAPRSPHRAIPNRATTGKCAPPESETLTIYGDKGVSQLTLGWGRPSVCGGLAGRLHAPASVVFITRSSPQAPGRSQANASLDLLEKQV